MTFAFSFPFDKLVRMSMFKVIVNLNTKTEVVSDVTVDVKDGVSVVVVVLHGFSYFGVVGSCDGMVTTESLLHVPQH